MARILVVDDDDGIVTFLIDLLTGEGHEARGSSGEAGLGQALEWQPELVLLDLMMPGLDGFAFYRRLQADPRTRRIPVVVMSADHHLREHCRCLPAQGFLAKPFDIVHLLDWVERLTAAGHEPPAPAEEPRHASGACGASSGL